VAAEVRFPRAVDLPFGHSALLQLELQPPAVPFSPGARCLGGHSEEVKGSRLADLLQLLRTQDLGAVPRLLFLGSRLFQGFSEGFQLSFRHFC